MRTTKVLKKVETLSQEVTTRIFPAGMRALDVDLLYGLKTGWVLLEFLRAITVRAADSHPRRYWDKNWRKFCRLWELAKALDGDLFLVNYETDPRDGALCALCGRDRLAVNFGQFVVLKSDMNREPSQFVPITTSLVFNEGGFDQFSRWLRELDSLAV